MWNSVSDSFCIIWTFLLIQQMLSIIYINDLVTWSWTVKSWNHQTCAAMKRRWPSSRLISLSRRWNQSMFYFFMVLFVCLLCAGTDPEDTILNAFKMFDPDAQGFILKDEYVLSVSSVYRCRCCCSEKINSCPGFSFSDYRNYWWHKQTSSHLRRCRTDPVHFTFISIWVV